MRKAYTDIRLLAALALALGVTSAGAQGYDCKKICDHMRDSCMQQCPGSPDPGQCKGNCDAVHKGCLTNCENAKLDGDGARTSDLTMR